MWGNRCKEVRELSAEATSMLRSLGMSGSLLKWDSQMMIIIILKTQLLSMKLEAWNVKLFWWSNTANSFSLEGPVKYPSPVLHKLPLAWPFPAASPCSWSGWTECLNSHLPQFHLIRFHSYENALDLESALHPVWPASNLHGARRAGKNFFYLFTMSLIHLLNLQESRTIS